jgi:hypothetical protein
MKEPESEVLKIEESELLGTDSTSLKLMTINYIRVQISTTASIIV